MIEPIGVLNLAQCPQTTQRSRLHKSRRYISPKFQGQNHRSFIGNHNKCTHSLYFCHAAISSDPSSLRYQKNFHSYTSTTSIGNHKLGYRFDSDSFQIGVDNQSSFSISNNLEHFVSPPSPISAKLIGVNGVSSILAKGTVCWKIDDNNGRSHRITLPNTLYVPSSPICLLSPQHWSQTSDDHSPEKDGTWCATYSETVDLHWDQRRYHRTIPINNRTNTPVFMSSSGTSHAQCSVAVLDAATNIDTENTFQYCMSCAATTPPAPGSQFIPPDKTNDVTPTSTSSSPTSDLPPDSKYIPSPPSLLDVFPLPSRPPRVDEAADDLETSAMTPQAELLRWHYRLSHLPFAILHLLANLRIIPYHLRLIRPPKCACCMYGNMTKTPWRVKGAANRRKIHPATKPGECVSVDQLESLTLGFLAQIKGRLTRRRYKAATVFLDHFSDLSYVHLQSSTNGDETLDAKVAFEAYARHHGVRILHYHGDNGRFAESKWINHCTANGQSMSYCAAYAHFQNGRAEKRIRDLQEQGRKLLIHAISRWPSAINIHLWPYALRHANDVRNVIPNRADGTSPFDRFASVSMAPSLRLFHTFGCPIFALSTSLQNGQTIPKWSPRARMGIYLGNSPRHARSVSLILSLSTGLCSPQFHVSHDDFFETTRSQQHQDTSSKWQSLSGLTLESPSQATEPSVPPPSEGDLLPMIPPSEGGFLSSMSPSEGAVPTSPPSITSTTRDTDDHIDSVLLQPEDIDIPFIDSDNLQVPCPSPPSLPTPPKLPRQPKSTRQLTSAKVPHIIPNLPPTRSGRPRKLSSKFKDSIASGMSRAYSTYYDAHHQDDYLTQDAMLDPISFAAKSDPDTMYYHQAIKEPDACHFIAAMVDELNEHIRRGHWSLVPLSDVPPNTRILDSIWAMKRKRDIISRKVYKWKARLNIHGGQQEKGVNYNDTYSPVVGWFSIRILLILSLLNGWHTRQIDFILAFPQATIEFDLYMKLPAGTILAEGNTETHVLLLHKNLYGQKQAGRVWNAHLDKGLRKIGFIPSSIDECVYTFGSLIFMVYVDDGILIGKTASDIDKIISQLRLLYDLTDEGQIEDYLGIHVEHLPGSRIKLSQPHLIDQIIKDVQLSHKAKVKRTPAISSRILQRCENAPSFQPHFHYRSIVGKLNFLEKGSRPDIAYAVHQCARFSEDPKKEHCDALIQICTYLRDTRTQGIILDPDPAKSLEVYVDADFCGNWNRTTAMDDVSTAKSRTGYVILLAGCPIIWASRLQTQIALSTTEAEYIALSTSLRDTIPIMNLLKELKHRNFNIISTQASVQCTAFEDNNGALEIANVPKMRPRTKHINLVYHFFRSHVGKDIFIRPIHTDNQIADIFTKPLCYITFQRHRKSLQYF